MRALLDTHVLLWWLTDADRLSTAARALFTERRSELLWSAASTWELGIKAQLGKLRLNEPIERFIPRQLREQALTGLPIYHDHAVCAATLPSLHRDPFDRMLVAQAMVEKVPIVTRDAALAEYGIDHIDA